MLLRPRLQSLPHPLTNPWVLDMHEFRADGVGINSLEAGDHFAQGHRLIIEEKFRRNPKIEICFAKSELVQTEQRIVRSRLCQRIDACNGMSERTIGVNETIDTCLQCCLASLGLRHSGPIALRQIPELEPFEKGRPSRID